MKRKSTAAAVAITAAMSLGLAACGGGGGDGGGGGEGAGYNVASNKVVNPSEAKGGTIKYAHSDEPDSMDPGDTYYAFNWNFTRNYARPLLTFAQKPGEAGNELVPDLATGLGKPSKDLKTWTYTLKDGVTFEDGTPVTSEDVKYAVARSNYTDELINGPKYFAQYLDAGNYAGPYKDKNLDNFTGIETPDDKTIVFKLNQPFAEMDYLVTNPQTAPVPADKDTGLDYQEHPVSTGPYKFENYDVGQKLSLVRNTNWDPATDEQRTQLPDRIEIQFKVEANDIDNRLLAGDIDVGLDGTGVQAAARAKILGDDALKARADNPQTGFLRYAMLSTKVPPFDNIECRKAVQYAADRVAMQAAWGGPIGGEIATTTLPPSVIGYKKDVTWQAGKDNRGDIPQAKTALEACGQPDGFTTNIAVRGDRPEDVATGEAIQASIARAGIKAQIKKYPSGDWSAQYAGRPDFVHKNNLGIIVAGWGADWPDGFGFLSQIADGRAIAPSGNYNQMELNDPEINKLLDEGVQTTDEAKRTAMWTQIDKKVMESAALLPIVYEKTLVYRPENLTNVYVSPSYGMYNFINMGTKK